MISVIVCSSQNPEWDYHERNVKKTIGCDYEYIRIENARNTYGICAAYNEGVSRATGDLLVFVHEDVFFMEPGWGDLLRRRFDDDHELGLIGVAGTQFLLEDSPLWLAAGEPYLRGRVVHEIEDGRKYYLSVFSWEQRDAEVVAVDGLFFAIPRRLFWQIKFDDTTFDRFHFYDLDICMQIHRTHKIIVTWDVLVKHLSAGAFDETWVEAGKRFLEKYKDELPASCVDTKVLGKKGRPGKNYDLKGRVRQGIIV
jgi:glycosyltransferase involved in cell wall biosynthesis